MRLPCARRSRNRGDGDGSKGSGTGDDSGTAGISDLTDEGLGTSAGKTLAACVEGNSSDVKPQELAVGRLTWRLVSPHSDAGGEDPMRVTERRPRWGNADEAGGGTDNSSDAHGIVAAASASARPVLCFQPTSDAKSEGLSPSAVSSPTTVETPRQMIARLMLSRQ